MTKIERTRQLLAMAKEQGVSDVEIDGIKFKLNRPEHFPIISDKPAQEDEKELIVQLSKTPFDDMSEEEIIYYATPYFEELQARRREREETQTTDKGLKDG